MAKKVLITLIAFLLIAGMLGCSSQGATTSNSPSVEQATASTIEQTTTPTATSSVTQEAKKKPLIGFACAEEVNEWDVWILNGVKRAAAEAGY